MNDLDFTGRNVVVIGGTSGINRGIARQFAARGANVAVASRSQDKVDDTIAELNGIGGGKVAGFRCDVRKYEEVEAGLARVQADWGDIDVLVSGAAGNFPALAEDLSVNGFRTVVDIDLLGTFNVFKAALPFLRKPGASAINISAPQARMAYEGQVHVSAAKAGVDMITRSLALEWGEKGLRVNSVTPGMIAETEGVRRVTPTPDMLAAVLAEIPAGRLGTTDDIGRLCLFLASDMATYITGQVIDVDGGLYLRGSSMLGKQMGAALRAVV